jgi:CubicO group peptidase (beta-lactamase class C family)
MRNVWFLITVLVVLSMLTSACAAPTPTATPVPPTKPPAPTATPKPSRLPDPDEVKALLVQLVDVEKRAPGIVVGMIADDPQERWVLGYGELSAADTRVPDGDTLFEIVGNQGVHRDLAGASRVKWRGQVGRSDINVSP